MSLYCRFGGMKVGHCVPPYLKNLAAAAEQAASDRRAHRHAAVTATPAGPVCPHCGRICASDFGLRSHLRVHL